MIWHAGKIFDYNIVSLLEIVQIPEVYSLEAESGTGIPTYAFAADTVLSFESPQDHSPDSGDVVQLLSENESSSSSESEREN